MLSYITSSKYGRALYGEGLRGLLATENEINYLVDYGDEHVFAAITNTWVIQLSSKHPDPDHNFNLLKSIDSPPISVPQAQLTSEAWAFNDDATEAVKNKIKNAGPLLKNSSYRISYGLKTGLNEAFVIDELIKDELVAADTKNSEILMPLLRGRDIARYETKPIISWIIATKNEFKVSQQYPSIAKYLEKRDKALGGKIRKRGDQGAHWMNLRDCAYYELMEGEKLVWLELTDRNKFTYTNKGEYILAGAWMITGPNLKALLGVMNSKLVNYYFSFVSNSSGMGTTQWKKFAVENIPIPDFSRTPKALVSKLVTLVDKRLKMSIAEHQSESVELESEIDKVVYQIYSLNSEDIALIETD